MYIIDSLVSARDCGLLPGGNGHLGFCQRPLISKVLFVL